MAATTVPSGSGNDVIIIPEGVDEGVIDVVELPNADVTEIAVNSPVKGLEVGVSGEKDVAIAGTTLKQTKLSNEAPKGETAKVTLAVTKAAKLEFVTTGKGATELSAAEGKLLKPSITTAKGKAEDSISFGAASTVKAAFISTGKGNDTVTFSGRMKGKTTVESGKGRDLIEVNSKDRGKGKLVLSDFNKKDTLVIGDETFTTKNSDEAPKWVKFDA